jgi:hypothetical protein
MAHDPDRVSPASPDRMDDAALSPAAEGEQEQAFRYGFAKGHQLIDAEDEACEKYRTALVAEGRRAPILKPLDIIDGRVPCPKCGEKGDLIAAQCDAEAPQDVWECPACRHQWLTGAEG